MDRKWKQRERNQSPRVSFKSMPPLTGSLDSCFLKVSTTGLANVHCQLGRIWNDIDTRYRYSCMCEIQWGCFQRSWTGRDHPKCGWHHILGSGGLRQNKADKKGKLAGHQCSLLTLEAMWPIASYFCCHKVSYVLSSPFLPIGRLYPQNRSQNKCFLKLLFLGTLS